MWKVVIGALAGFGIGNVTGAILGVSKVNKCDKKTAYMLIKDSFDGEDEEAEVEEDAKEENK